MRHLVAGPNDLFLATITTGGMLLTTVMLNDKSLRVGDLDKVVRVLFRGDPIIGEHVMNRTRRWSLTQSNVRMCHNQGNPNISGTG